MTKEEIAGVLENFGRLLELKGENPFKIRAYANAIRALETLPEPLEKLVAEKRLTEVEGIGEAIAEKITVLFETGRLPQYDELRESFPADILTLFELQGLGAKKIKAIHDALKISSLTALSRACKDGRIAELPALAKKRRRTSWPPSSTASATSASSCSATSRRSRGDCSTTCARIPR